MGFACVHSRALLGLQAPLVQVEVHLASGLPGFNLVGLAETEVKEARERVRSALQNAGLPFPGNQRITVNLGPADLPKDSGRFDLPIAMGILAAAGHIDTTQLGLYEFGGELSLSGELRPVRGALAMALALRGQDRRWVLPTPSAQEAACVPGVEVYGVGHLLDAVRPFLVRALDQISPDTEAWRPLPLRQLGNASSGPDLADVRGQSAARRALEIAAAGGHSLLMWGPPGSGKSMLAERLAGLLPPMTMEEALESAAMSSLGGQFDPARWGQRITCSPHHSASAVALVGGGSPPRPGEISLAHHGVLFLDELPEFKRSALEALREPLESGRITVARAARRAEYPARFQLIAAMNPCPCGHLGSRLKPCRCTPDQIARYQGRLSGPLLDRIDLHVAVSALPAQDILQSASSECSAVVAQRCKQAREKALQRQGCANVALNANQLHHAADLDTTARDFLSQAAQRLGWSGRGVHRTLRVARTIADLAESATIQIDHLAEALQYRQPLQR